MNLIRLELRKNSCIKVLLWTLVISVFITWTILLILKIESLEFIQLIRIIDGIMGMYIILITSFTYNKYFINDINKEWFELMRSYPIKRKALLLIKFSLVISISLLVSSILYNVVCLSTYTISLIIDNPIVGINHISFLKSEVYILCFCLVYCLIGLLPSGLATIKQSSTWMIVLSVFLALVINSIGDNMWTTALNYQSILLGILGFASVCYSMWYIDKKI